MRRLTIELESLQLPGSRHYHPLPFPCTVTPRYDEVALVPVWTISMPGPPNTVYESGVFEFELRFPLSYPFKAPITRLITKIYHPSVIHNNMLGPDHIEWNPTTKARTVIELVYKTLQVRNSYKILTTQP